MVWRKLDHLLKGDCKFTLVFILAALHSVQWCAQNTTHTQRFHWYILNACLPSALSEFKVRHTLSSGFSCLLLSRQKCWARIVDEWQRDRARAAADRGLRNSRGEGKPHSLRITLVKVGKRLHLKGVKTLISMLSFQQDYLFILTKKTPMYPIQTLVAVCLQLWSLKYLCIWKQWLIWWHM